MEKDFGPSIAGNGFQIGVCPPVVDGVDKVGHSVGDYSSTTNNEIMKAKQKNALSVRFIQGEACGENDLTQ
jgi:hypothetical protein